MPKNLFSYSIEFTWWATQMSRNAKAKEKPTTKTLLYFVCACYNTLQLHHHIEQCKLYM